MRALTRPWRSSFSTRAPTIRIAKPSTFNAMISWPRRVPGSQGRRRGLRRRSGFAVSVSNAIEGFDRVELGVHVSELLAHALDVAVDGAVVDIDLIVVGRVHQVVAALHEAWPLGQRLQEQEFGHGQLYRLAFPQAVVARRIQRQLAPFD